VQTTTTPHFFTEAQVRELRRDDLFLHGRDRAILEVLLATGLRASELLALNVEDIQDDRLLVRRGKGGKSRFVPLTRRARAALTPVLYQKSRYAAVFTNRLCYRGNKRGGQRLSRRGLHRIVKAYLRTVGLTGSLHTFRSTAATRWLNAGVGLRSVQVMLGHADVSTTARSYLGVAVDGLVAELRGCLGE